MTTNTYNLGDRVRCTGTIEQTDGTNIDPSVVKGWYRNPANEVTTLTYPATVTKSATGIYYFDLDVDTAGEWHYGFYSTGTGKAASADTKIVVKASKRT